MNSRTFNIGASLSAFFLGTVYLFSDTASITANVIGSSGSNASLASIMGMMMILGSIGLFIVSMKSTDNHSLDLERLIRGTKYSEEIKTESKSDEEEKYSEYTGENTKQ
ncbi:MAG: hypothetical protein ACP5N1_01940 [Candidatus Woesearchaeota archaeon]